MENLKELVYKINNLTLIESYHLVKELEKIFEISISGVNSSLTVSKTVENTDLLQDIKKDEKVISKEKINHDIILQSIPSDNKINIIKAIKNITGLSLKECKDIVDNVPKIIKKGISTEECEKIKMDLENLGSKIIIQ
jgi:large subunit ribosomal protein L7/L12